MAGAKTRLRVAQLGISLVVALGACRCAGDQNVNLVRALPGDAKVQVAWSSLHARAYEVYWRAGAGVQIGADAVARAEAPRLLFSGLVNGQPYCFRVRALGWGSTGTSPEVCATPDAALRPRLDRIAPESVPSGTPTTLALEGERFSSAARALVDGVPVPTAFLDERRLEARLGPLGRGSRQIRVEQSLELSEPLALEIADRPPLIALPPPSALSVDEEQTFTLGFSASDPEGDPVRLHPVQLPPGARWDEASATLTFKPTFIQGGGSLPCVLAAVDRYGARAETRFDVQVADTIAPPRPRVVSARSGPGYRILTLSQRTDEFLDSPGWAGREFEALLALPDPLNGPLPVRVQLHGFSSTVSASASNQEIRLYPKDPNNTYWWGYADSLPGSGEPTAGKVPDYTARRVLALLEWVLDEYPEADPERVYVVGASMGGAGALTIGLRYARHFAWVEAYAAQTIPRQHRPSRVAQLRGLWGPPELDLDAGNGLGVWSALDVARELADSPEAREQFVILKHGKDDPVIHFWAAVVPSELTERSVYATLQERRVGHLAIWDEASHDAADPVLGQRWWGNWTPLTDAEADLGRARAFPAFTRCTADRAAGDGSGNGRRVWDAETGFAGSAGAAGDTGWSGALAGTLNRGLRWRAVRETTEVVRVELRTADGSGGTPRAGYPPTGEKFDGSLPVAVDVTLRRLQSFRLLPGERVAWSFGGLSGEVEADAEGLVTVPALPLGAEWTELRLERR